MSSLAAYRSRRTPPRCRAWLAILAVLLDTLLPAGFSAAAPSAAPPIGFCGSAPAQKSLPAGAHCIYCFVVPVGPAPPPIPTLRLPQAVGIAVVSPVRPRIGLRPAAFAAAQPRGPPPAAG